MKVGVLASGSGSNFAALVEGLHQPDSPARIVTLICNVPEAGVLARAEKLGVSAQLIPHRDYPTRAAHDEAVVEHLQRCGVELICLAGYMRLVTPVLLDRFPNRVLNVHPALLPSFPGMHAPRQALAAGVRLTGCTVHLVDNGTDTGPIVAQAAVSVLPFDDEAALTARIQREEHRLFATVVKAFARGVVSVEGRTVRLTEPLQ